MTTCTLKIGLMSEGYPLSQHFAKCDISESEYVQTENVWKTNL